MAKIDGKTKVIYYDLRSDTPGGYVTGKLEDRECGLIPVCTVDHLIDRLCTLFQEIYPDIKRNPLYQDINWDALDDPEEVAA